jgi:hypothetical protein
MAKLGQLACKRLSDHSGAENSDVHGMVPFLLSHEIEVLRERHKRPQFERFA